MDNFQTFSKFLDYIESRKSEYIGLCSICYGPIFIILFLIELIFFDDFRGLHLFNPWRNSGWMFNVILYALISVS